MRRPLALVFLIPTLAAATPVLDRNLSHYTILAMRGLRLKNFAMEAPGCNIGVDCPTPFLGAPCGIMRGKNVHLHGTAQAVADHICATGTFFEVFRNNPTFICSPDCTMISDPGPGGDCTTSFVTPVIGDLNGNGKPSCSGDCEVDPGDIAQACGVTLPLPACDPTRPITVTQNGDCSADDLVPGNFQCDLPAGTYGNIWVKNGGRIVFAPGTTVACNVKAGKATRLSSTGPAKVLVTPGTVRINNTSDAGNYCDQLSFVTDRGGITLGKNGDYAVNACSIGGTVKLGHGNNLRGRFIGIDVGMDFNNDGRCCESAPTTTTTTTTTLTLPATTSTTATTVVTTTSTSGTASTTTTATVVSSTTTTTTSAASTSTSTTSTTGAGSTTTTVSSTSTTTGAASTSTTTTGAASSTTSTTVGSTSTTTTTASTSTTSSTGATTTTTGAGSTSTSTTLAGGFTRTLGFYKTHPDITQAILDAHGPLSICGHTITDTAVNDAHSALEALCESPQGDQRLQLVRQLTAAALSTAAGGAQFDVATCNSVCVDPGATTAELTTCIDAADAFNNSGDNLPAPWDPPGAANPSPCDLAADTPCTVLNPSACATQ